MSETEEIREVVYPEIEARLCLDDDPITETQAEFLLGWEETEEPVGAMLKDEYGKFVLTKKNNSNRPLAMGDIRSLMSDILGGKWNFNGESMIFGKYGICLSAQHRLIALKMAVQRWRIDLLASIKEATELRCPIKYRWPFWKDKEPFITSVMVFGVEEIDEVINTLDTGRGRSYSDAVYRCQELKHLQPKDRKVCARMLDHAIRLLWERTGAGLGAYSKKVTHADRMDFWHRHPSVLRAVGHIFETNKDGSLAKLLSPGYLSGMLYLMSASATPAVIPDPNNPDNLLDHPYRVATAPTEDMIDLSRFDQACEFITLAAQGKLKEYTDSIATMLNSPYSISLDERLDLLINTWNAYIEGDEINMETLGLEVQEYVMIDGKIGKMLCLIGSQVDTQHGCRLMLETEHPVVGGIDLGHVEAIDEGKIAEVAPGVKDPNGGKANIGEGFSGEIASRTAAERKPKKKKLTTHKAGSEWDVDDVAWVRESGSDDPYLARIVEVVETDDGSVITTVQDENGDHWDAGIEYLFLEKPEPKKSSTKAKGDKVNLIIGKLYWSKDGDEPWLGRLKDVNPPKGTAILTVQPGHRGAGNDEEVPASSLSLNQPTE